MTTFSSEFPQINVLIMRESIPRQVDRKSRDPQGERSGVLEEEREVWNSQGGGKEKFFFSPSTFLRII